MVKSLSRVEAKLYLYFNSIMSHVLNNVGPGLNIAVINGEYNSVWYPQ